LIELLSKAVEFCPRAENLWLMAAKEAWLGGDIAVARNILGNAFDANSESEAIWLAAAKLEADNGEIQNARQLLERARSEADTERVRILSILHRSNI
jgi:pre-mRNA-processing factor 6